MSKISDLELIGQGEFAEVYGWEEGQVIKLYRQGHPRHKMEHEAHVAQIVHKHGLPVPAFHGTVEVDGRSGIIYERVIGTSMLETFVTRPAVAPWLIRTFAELHAEIHHLTKIDGLPTQRQIFKEKIQSVEPGLLAPELCAEVLDILDRMPVAHQLCHGDFHPGNVILTETGAVVIDWSSARNGNPLADVAYSSLMLSKGTPYDKPLPWILNLPRQWIHRRYLKRYFRFRPARKQEFKQWLIICAAFRLSEGVPGKDPINETKKLLTLIQKGLSL